MQHCNLCYLIIADIVFIYLIYDSYSKWELLVIQTSLIQHVSSWIISKFETIFSL